MALTACYCVELEMALEAATEITTAYLLQPD